MSNWECMDLDDILKENKEQDSYSHSHFGTQQRPATPPPQYNGNGKREAPAEFEIEIDPDDEFVDELGEESWPMRAQNRAPAKHQKRKGDSGGDDEEMKDNSSNFRRFDFGLPQLIGNGQPPSSHSLVTYSYSRTPQIPTVPQNGLHVLNRSDGDLDAMMACRYPMMSYRGFLSLAISVDATDLFIGQENIPKTIMSHLCALAKNALNSPSCTQSATAQQLSHLRNLARNEPPFGLVVVSDIAWRPKDIPTDAVFFEKYPSLRNLSVRDGFRLPADVVRQIKI